MPLPLIASVLVGAVTGLLVTALAAPGALAGGAWRPLAALGGMALLVFAGAALWRRLARRAELLLEDALEEPSAATAGAPVATSRARAGGPLLWLLGLWEALVWRIDALLGGPVPAPSMPAGSEHEPPPTAPAVRMRPPEGAPPAEPADFETVVRLPQRIPCMLRLPARGERSPGRELGRLARAIARVKEPGGPAGAAALLVDIDPMVLVTAGARSRLQALANDPAPAGCTLVLVLEPPVGEGPEALPVDLLTDLLAPGRIELGLRVRDPAGLSAERIRRLGFSFLLLPAGPLRAHSPDDPVDPALVALFEDCRRAGVSAVVEGVDGERILLDVLDYPVELACGALFAPAEEAPARGRGRRVA